MSDLSVVDDGRIRLITLNRPQCHNAFTLEVLVALKEALLHPGDSLAVVVTGTGRSFSSGADVNEIEGSEKDIAFDDAVTAASQAAEITDIPVIAAVEGSCIGAAFDFVTACDVRVVARSATFALPAARLGLLYNPTSLARMRDTIGATALARILLTADTISAEEALALNIASVVVEDGSALDRARALAEQTASCDPHAITATKGLLLSLAKRRPVDQWQRLRRELVGSQFRRAALAAHPGRRRKEDQGRG